MKSVTIQDLKVLQVPLPDSHKGQNGRLLIIGGSTLFHAASIWALEVASRIVDLVHYASTPENNEIVMEVKKQFRDGIVIPREHIGEYIKEDDCVLIGPGMTRDDETANLTHALLSAYPNKQWVIDAGALQMLELADIPKNAILTPHHGEFESLFKRAEVGISLTSHRQGPDHSPTMLVGGAKAMTMLETKHLPALSDIDKVKLFSKTYHCIVLLKGQRDIAVSGGACDERICTPGEVRVIEGGNEGMTKGGTGDVLAGLIAALACKNDPFLATIAGSFINKKAGDELYKSVGPFFNASDLASQIPKTIKVTIQAFQ
ncbi:MAG TPA: ADP/ATP-dependent (S)-NAD(P)H-hydrate dehydratase [Patescibacteria group bacterium]|nr:ADP/ATP-dependent (S)-NAD(P)H-hydrate dehydratase [Patescibacteria group bacterium]